MINRPIVFTHIPKAAGSALNASLRHALKPDRPLSGFDHAIFGNFDEFNSILETHRQHIYARPEDLPGNADFIGGHFAHATTRKAFPTARHLVVLREPVTRVLSQWMYWRAQDEVSLAGWGSWCARVLTAYQPLVAYLNDPLAACQADNLTLRMLLWPHPLIPGDGFIKPEDDAALLKEASARLGEYDHADIIENPEFEEGLRRWLGRDLALMRVNETPAIPEGRSAVLHEEMTTVALELLQQRSRLDIALWKQAAATVMAPEAVDALRARTLLWTAARHARLLAPASSRKAARLF